MCLVACGSADAYYHMGIHCWDMAGGAAVVREAGGVIVDISGESKSQTFSNIVTDMKEKTSENSSLPAFFNELFIS